MNEKTIVVTGAGGFIGHHLVKRLAAEEGNFVVGVDLKHPQFEKTAADEFLIADLRDPTMFARLDLFESCEEVYALAADMGGMGFISTAECDILRNNALININTVDAAAQAGVKRYFFSSSVCVYRDMRATEKMISEDDAVPANPHNEYGWEKFYAERVALAHSRKFDMQVRIARFENCYGPLGTWHGGREKAPAAICRKVANAPDGGVIEVWGDGKAVRVFTYVDDLVEGIVTLMRSDLEGPTNIGCDERATVADLVETVINASGKKLGVKYVDGPVGVHSRNFSKARIHSLGWSSKVSLREGIAKTYAWVEEQVKKSPIKWANE